MKPAGGSPLESVWLYAVAGALMTGGPVWHYLFVNRYPFDRPEAVFLPLAAGLLGAGIAVLGRRLGGLLASLSFGALLYVFVDLQLNLEQSVRTLLVALGCVVLAHLLRSRRALLICLMLGTFNLASLPRRGGTPAPPREAAGIRRPDSLPVLVHIVLDEQWGIGGLRAAGDQATAQFLTAFYLERGFEVYEGAYSRWGRTRTSIPEAFSLGRPAEVEPLPANARLPTGFRLRANPYFERLRDIGYRIEVRQSNHLDFCRRAEALVAWCHTTPGNSIASIGHLGGAWPARAHLAGRYFLNVTSHAYARLKRPPDGDGWRLATAGNALAQLRELRDAIASGKAYGTAFFVHVLLPHHPLEVDADCAAFSDPDLRVGFDPPKNLRYREVLALYGGQTRCVHRAVSGILDALDRTVGRDGAIVIVHGDHGWRMDQDPSDAPAAELERERLNSVFSSLLAIRRPGVPAAHRGEAVPIQDFLWRLIESTFQGAVSPVWEHFVYLPFPVGQDTWPGPTPIRRELNEKEMPWAGTTP